MRLTTLPLLESKYSQIELVLWHGPHLGRPGSHRVFLCEFVSLCYWEACKHTCRHRVHAVRVCATADEPAAALLEMSFRAAALEWFTLAAVDLA